MKLIKNSDGPHATSHAGHSEKNGEKNRYGPHDTRKCRVRPIVKKSEN